MSGVTNAHRVQEDGLLHQGMACLLPLIEAHHDGRGIGEPQLRKRLGREGCAVAVLALQVDRSVRVRVGGKPDLLPDPKFDESAGNVDRARHMSGRELLRFAHIYN